MFLTPLAFDAAEIYVNNDADIGRIKSVFTSINHFNIRWDQEQQIPFQRYTLQLLKEEDLTNTSHQQVLPPERRMSPAPLESSSAVLAPSLIYSLPVSQFRLRLAAMVMSSFRRFPSFLSFQQNDSEVCG